jgi:CHRD domain
VPQAKRRGEEKTLRKARGRKLTGALLALVLATVVAVVASTAAAQAAGRSVTFHVPLSGLDPNGSGVANLRIKPATNTLCYVIVVKNIGAPTEPAPGLGNAHIHGPRPATGIAVHLDTEFSKAGASDVFHARDCVDVAPAALAAVLANPQQFYVNIHTVQFPGGAIEGNLA